MGVCVCTCVCMYVCLYGFFVIEAEPSLILLSITSSKNPYRQPFGEFQSHFGYRAGLDVRMGGGKIEAKGGGGGGRRAGSADGWSSSDNPHRLADQSAENRHRRDKRQMEKAGIRLVRKRGKRERGGEKDR